MTNTNNHSGWRASWQIASGGMIALGLIVLGSGVAAAAPGDIVNIPDSNLRGCLNAALSQPPGADITEAQMSSITGVLDCSNMGIADITGISALSSVDILSLYGNQIYDFSPLGSNVALSQSSGQVIDVADPVKQYIPVPNPAKDNAGAPLKSSSSSYDEATNTFSFCTAKNPTEVDFAGYLVLNPGVGSGWTYTTGILRYDVLPADVSATVNATHGPIGQVQTAPVSLSGADSAATGGIVSIQFIDPNTSTAVSSLAVPGEGTYTSSGTDIAFTPYADFHGTATGVSVTVRLASSGCSLSAGKYQPVVNAPATTPTISNPADQAVNAGATATFTVKTTGTPVPTTTWEVSTDGGKTWSAISTDAAAKVSADGNTLTVSPAAKDHSGYRYRATATNSAGNVTSETALLTVKVPATPSDSDANGNAGSGGTGTSNGKPVVNTSLATTGGSSTLPFVLIGAGLLGAAAVVGAHLVAKRRQA